MDLEVGNNLNNMVESEPQENSHAKSDPDELPNSELNDVEELVIDESIDASNTHQQIELPAKLLDEIGSSDQRDDETIADDPSGDSINENIEGDDEFVDSETTSLCLILAGMNELSKQLAKLQKGFDSKLKYDSAKAETIEYQRQELQKFQGDFHLKILRPIFLDLIAMHDDFVNLIRYESKGENIGEIEQKMIRNLDSFKQTIESILEHHGVTIIQTESEKFDSKNQRVRKVIKTNEMDLDGIICEKLQRGFSYEEKNLRSEIVSVYKYVEPQNLEQSEDDEQSSVSVEVNE